jgi:hypothetical protein
LGKNQKQPNNTLKKIEARGNRAFCFMGQAGLKTRLYENPRHRH